jgi:glycosyltransferase involved in cell wall biosynthesis
VRGIGHAIDVDLFTPAADRRTDRPLRLLALGRTARWKGYETMLAALETAVAWGLEAELEVRGPQLTDDERAHRAELEAAVAASDALRGRVRIDPPVPRDELPALLAGADALLSATQPRASLTLDKVVYEAAAAGVPVLASNPGLDEFLGGLPLELGFPGRDAGALAARLLALAAASADVRAATGAELRRRVVEGHSLQSWVEGVAAALADQRRE